MWYINLSRANLSFTSIGPRAIRCSSLKRFFISVDNKRTATCVQGVYAGLQKPIDLLLRDHIRYLNSCVGRLRPDGDWL